MDKNNRNKIIIGIISTVILLIGGTYAAWTFLTEKTEVTVLVDGDQISFTAGESISVSGILPVNTPEEGIVKEIIVYKQNGEYIAGIDLYLDLTTWPTAFASSSFRWALYKNGNYLSSGDFSSTKESDDIKLTSYSQKINLEGNKDVYNLYLWIDAASESSIDMMNNSFTVNLYGKVDFYDENDEVLEEVEPNAPELAEGMIPIRYNYVLDEWEKANSDNVDNNWYNYYDKMWANAVFVTSETRNDYINADVGTTIDKNDVIAYYVWIPRYKYLLFNVNSEVTTPREIQIIFEKTTDTISNGDENGEYLSHPAFWWDNDSNTERASDGSEELSGIWFGKFETSGTLDEPKIMPNTPSTTTLSVSALFNMNKKLQNTLNMTEEGASEIDTHMVKNTDWGAVAYLSHSRYGINKEIKRNSNSNYITGRQGNYTYNDFLVNNGIMTSVKTPGTGTLASTTGNVYGVYDMSGCGNEYVMGVEKVSGSDDEPYLNRGNFTTTPLPKYYNLYDYSSSSTDHTRRILGDATGETYGWYGDAAKFVSSANSWFSRGSNINDTTGAGIFAFSNYAGISDASYSSRGVLVIP